jgi:hypothetical protein
MDSDDERARRLEALFAAHGSDIVAYCSWRTRSASDAQDATADVFLTAWRRLDEVPDGDEAACGSTPPPAGWSQISGGHSVGVSLSMSG